MSADISREAADQAYVTATNIWNAVNEALQREYPDKGPPFKPSMRDKLAAGLREVFSHIEAKAEERGALGPSASWVDLKNDYDALVIGKEELREENNELRAECERLRAQLNSANQQHQLKAI